MGTPAYCRRSKGKAEPADARSDIYSFGCVLYEMLTGAPGWVSAEALAPKAGKHRKPVSGGRSGSAGGNPSANSSGSFQSLPGHTPRQTQRRGRRLASRASFASPAPPDSWSKGTIVLADSPMPLATAPSMGRCSQIVAVQLDHSSRLSLLPDARVRETLGLMGRRRIRSSRPMLPPKSASGQRARQSWRARSRASGVGTR